MKTLKVNYPGLGGQIVPSVLAQGRDFAMSGKLRGAIMSIPELYIYAVLPVG